LTADRQQQSDPAAEASLSRLRGLPLLTALGERMPGAEVRAELAARLAEALTRRLEAAGPEAPMIVEAARLQEVGKLYVEADLLTRAPSELEPQQRVALDSHYEHGRALAYGAGVSEPVCDWILHARERWDGSGPEGLAGEQIPLGARVTAVTRVYLDSGAGVEGVAALIGESGQSLDPTVAAVAAELTASGGF
jgi:response regulator RpfG family c-di-GMP phosphodiesterase